VIRAGQVLIAPGQVPPLGPTEIHVTDGRIDRLESISIDCLTQYERDSIILPAFCNAHDHGRGLRTISMGTQDDHLELWMHDLRRQPVVDLYIDAAVAFSRMVRSGICATNHCHTPKNGIAMVDEAKAVRQAATDIGFRVAFALPFFDHNTLTYDDPEAFLAQMPPDDRDALCMQLNRIRPAGMNLAFADEIAAMENEFFHLQYHPVGPQWTRPETLEAIAEASARTGRLMHMHLLETRAQREWADRTYPTGLIPFLDQLGLLTPRLTVAHGVWLRPDECILLAERGVTVALNLSSNLRLRSGLPPIAAMHAVGMNLAIGLDGMSFDDDEDMAKELRLLWRIGQLEPSEKGFEGPADLFKAALETGRRTVLGVDGGGRIVAGAPADFIVVDGGTIMRDFVDVPLDPIIPILSRMTKSHILETIIAGKRIMANGRCLSIDDHALEIELIAQARASAHANPANSGFISRLKARVKANTEPKFN
jgi:cytosine/adenosine deaminase-related metal-dependent hydrolase